MHRRLVELIVGIFVVLVIIAFIFLAFKVSGLTSLSGASGYEVTADFDNIGGLKTRAPVRISGVEVGQVDSITLNPETFQAVVTMTISNKQNTLPVDTSASIYTEGLLGANYISLEPGYQTKYLKEGSVIKSTHSALVLEKLIGQFLFNVKKS